MVCSCSPAGQQQWEQASHVAQRWRHAMAAAPRFCAIGRVKSRHAASAPYSPPHLSRCQSRCGRSSSWRCQACYRLRARLLRAPASRLLRMHSVAPAQRFQAAAAGGRQGATEMREGATLREGAKAGLVACSLEGLSQGSLQAWDKSHRATKCLMPRTVPAEPDTAARRVPLCNPTHSQACCRCLAMTDWRLINARGAAAAGAAANSVASAASAVALVGGRTRAVRC